MTPRNIFYWVMGLAITTVLILILDLTQARPSYQSGTIVDRVIVNEQNSVQVGEVQMAAGSNSKFYLMVQDVYTGEVREVLVSRSQFYNSEHEVGRAVAYVDHLGFLTKVVWLSTLEDFR